MLSHINALINSHKSLSKDYSLHKKSHILEIKQILKEGTKFQFRECAYDLGDLYLTSKYKDIHSVGKPSYR
jgi:hypothetical protein